LGEAKRGGGDPPHKPKTSTLIRDQKGKTKTGKNTRSPLETPHPARRCFHPKIFWGKNGPKEKKKKSEKEKTGVKGGGGGGNQSRQFQENETESALPLP